MSLCSGGRDMAYTKSTWLLVVVMTTLLAVSCEGQTVTSCADVIAEGDTLTLSCVFDTPPGTFLWTDSTNPMATFVFNGDTGSTHAKYDNFQVAVDLVSSNITITNAQLEDEGMYTCTGGSTVAMPTVTVTVDVVGTWNNTIPPSPLVAGDSYNVSCNHIGSNPNVSLEWYLDDVMQVVDTTTTTTNMANAALFDTSISGMFTANRTSFLQLTCRAVGYRAASIPTQEIVMNYTVEYPPTNVTVVFNGLGTLVTCKIPIADEGSPASTNFYITYNNGTDYLIHESTTGVNSLAIPTPLTNTTTFTCLAGNAFGNVTAVHSYTPPDPTTPICPNSTVAKSDVPAGTDGTVYWTYPDTNINTDIYWLSSSPANGTAFAPGVTSVTVSLPVPVSHYSCSFNVTIIPPTTPACPDDIRAGLEIGGTDPNITWTYPPNNDTDLYPLVSDIVSGSAFSTGVTPVNVSRQDFGTFFCLFDVTVVAPTYPVCPGDITTGIEVGDTDAMVTWMYPANNDTDLYPLESDIVNGSAFSPGVTTVTVSRENFTDYNCTFTVTVIGPTDPVCPDDVTTLSDAGLLTAAVTWIYPDNNNTDLYPLTSDTVNGSAFGLGSTVVTVLRANFTTYNCTFTITVLPPDVPVCPMDIGNVTSDPGGLVAAVTWTYPAENNHTVTHPLDSDIASGSSFNPGVTTVTVFRMVNLTDYNCTFTVTVIPPTVPVCPADILNITDPGETSAVVSWSWPPANNMTALYPLVSDYASGSMFLPGNTTVTVWVDSFPEFNCSFVVGIIGPTVPVCPNSTVVGTDFHLPTAVVGWDYPPENSYLDLFPLTADPANGTAFDLGLTSVLVSLVDFPLFNCTFTVTVQDLEPPEINTTVPEVLNVGIGDLVTWSIFATDNLGPVIISSSHAPGSFFPLGQTTVTYTARDISNLVSTFTFTVNVIDDGSPVVANCPTDIAVVALAGQPTAEVSWTPPTATGTGAITTTNDFSPGDAFIIGTTRVTYTFTYTDVPGNSSECFFRVVVTAPEDTTPPTIPGCPADVIWDVPPGTESANVTWTEPDITDAASIQRSHIPGSSFNTGTTQILYIIMDQSYNRLQCMFSVTVNVVPDTVAPVFDACPANLTKWVALGVASTPVFWVAPNASDNYPDFTVTQTHSPGDTFLSNTDTPVTYTVTDVGMNTVTCSFVVSVLVDTVPPVIVCPDPITEFVDASVTSKPVTWPPPTVTDNSGATTVTVAPPSGTVFVASLSGQNDVVTVTATDAQGLSSTCTFTVNVLHDNAPVLTCPDIVANTLPDQTYADVSWPGVTIVDGMTPFADLVITMSHTQPLRLNYNDAPVDVTITATDSMDNVGTCTFSVSVQDAQPPVWTNCPADIVVAATPGTSNVLVSWTDPTVSDNAVEAPTVLRRPSATTQSYSTGTWQISYAAVDSSGNEGTCDFQVIVTVDGAAPVFTNCPTSPIEVTTAAGQDSAVVAWGIIEATDTSGPVTITSFFQSGEIYNIGSYVVEYKAVDATGNEAYCTFTVRVIDNENPAFLTCPSPAPVYVYDPSHTVPVTWPEPTATDNSGTVTVSLGSGSTASGSRFSLGTHLITYVARDADNNMVSTCQFTVTVATKPNSIQLRGMVVLDTVRGLDGPFTDSSRLTNLENDINDYFRASTSLSEDFLGFNIMQTSFNSDGNLEVVFDLYLSDPAYYNEEEIAFAFESALTSSVAFPTSNTIVINSFDLLVREFRGQFTLKSIVNPGITEVDFNACCTDPASDSYRDLANNRILPHLRRAYMDEPGFRMVQLQRLRAGSVVVPFTVTFDASATLSEDDFETQFNNDVTPGSLELSSGFDTGLYLITQQPFLTIKEEVCPPGYCLNGAQCVVQNMLLTYEFSCESCPTGFTGDRCQTATGGGTGTTTPGLSTGAIVGIVLGVLAFLLLMLLMCCCCWLFMASATPRYQKRPQEYHHAPIMLMPREPVQQPRGPIITEVEEGPRFFHDGDTDVPKHVPLALPAPTRPRAHQPIAINPSFMNEAYDYEDEVAYQPRPRPRERPRGRIRSTLERLPRPRPRPSSGPRFHGDDRPEPVGDMKRRLFQEFNY